MKPKQLKGGSGIGALPPLDIPEDNSFWLHMVRPGIFHSPNPDALCAESHLVLLAKLAANQVSSYSKMSIGYLTYVGIGGGPKGPEGTLPPEAILKPPL